MTKRSQNQIILEHLQKNKHITPLEALGVYGVYRLASRIDELRKAGHNIVTERVRDLLGKQYARYSLVTAPKPAPVCAPVLDVAA